MCKLLFYLLLVPVFLTLHTNVIAAPGDLDTSFGTNGSLTFGLANAHDEIRDLAVQSDGKVVVVAAFLGNFMIGRFQTNGTLDPAFGFGGWTTVDFGATNDTPEAVALDGAGRIVVAGYSGDDIALARLTPSGGLDSAFDGDGKLLTDYLADGWGNEHVNRARDLLIEPDGKIVISGHTDDENGFNADITLVRYHDSGTLDTTFGTGGIVYHGRDGTYYVGSSGAVIVRQPDGKYLVANHPPLDPYDYHDGILRFNPDGTLDTTFGHNGITHLSDAGYNYYSTETMLPQADGTILVPAIGDNIAILLFRLRSDGEPDTTFGTNGHVPLGLSGRNLAALQQPDGKIVIAAAPVLASSANGAFTVARLTANGLFDTTFSGDGVLTTNLGPRTLVNAIGLGQAGTIVVGGKAKDDYALIKVTSAGVMDSTFSGDGIVTLGYAGNDEATGLVYDPAEQMLQAVGNSEQKIGLLSVILSGSVSNAQQAGYAGSYVNRAAAIALDFTSNPQNPRAIIAGEMDGQMSMIQGNFEIVLQEYGWWGYTTNYSFLWQNTGRANFGNGPSAAQAVAVQTDRKYVVAGAAASPAGNLDFALARFQLVNGALLADNSFSGDGKLLLPISASEEDQATAVAIQADGKIVVGGYVWTGTNYSFAIARLFPDGSLDSSFSGDGKVITSFGAADSFGSALVLQPDGKIVLAGSANSDFAVVRYLADGSLDTSFSGDGKATTSLGGTDLGNAVALAKHGKIVVGGSTSVSGNAALAVFNTDGTIDTSFSGDGEVTHNFGSSQDDCRALVIQPDGKIVIAGRTHNGSDFDFALARFHGVGDPFISFSSASYTINEGAISYGINVTLNPPSTETLSAYILVNGETATRWSDYTVTNTTITFAPGETNKTFFITLIHDGIDEETETLECALLPFKNARAGSITTTTLSITDQDPSPAINLSAGLVRVAEDVGQVTLTANLGKSSGKTVRVNFATSSFAAVDGTDYRGTNGTLTFLPGQTTKSITIPILDDAYGEPNEAFSLNLSSPSNGVLGSISSSTVTILDDEPTLGFVSSGFSIPEAGNFINIGVALTAPSTVPVQVNFATAPGTATAGADYATTNGTLTIPAGQTAANFTVRIINDALLETNETILLSLSSPQNVIFGSVSNAVLNIIDTSALPTIQFGISNVLRSDGTLQVFEGSTLALHLSLSKPSTQTVTVSYTSESISATAGTDYSSAIGSISFSPGQTNRTFTLSTINNSTPEAEEKLRMYLRSPVNAVLATPTNHTVTIVDNDTTYLSFTPRNITISETGGVATVNVALTTASDATVKVDYAATEGTAQSTADFLAVSGTLTFDPGETNQTFTVPILNDQVDEGSETIQLALSSAQNASLQFSSATITIEDEDSPPTLSFLNASEAVAEDAGFIDIALSLSQPSEKTITAVISTSNSTATAGQDFSGTNTLITFVPGEVLQSFRLHLLEDNIYEATESLVLHMRTVTNATGLGTNATIALQNTTPVPQLTLATNVPLISESAGAYTVSVLLSHPSALPAAVAFQAFDGGSASPSDFIPTNGTIVFPAGQTNRSFTVGILHDSFIETNELISISLTTLSNVTRNISSTVTILDNDPAAVSFLTSSNAVSEASGSVVLQLGRQASGMTSYVAFATSDGTANTSDYTTTNGTVTFLPGETNQFITLAITQDATDELPEHFEVRLLGITNGLAGSPDTGRVHIVDDDPPRVLFGARQYAGLESAGTIQLSVLLSSSHDSTVYVDYATSDETATAGADYVAAAGTLVFAPGQTNKPIVLTLFNDTAPETNETLLVTLSNVSGGTLNNGSATIRIGDDDWVKLSITNLGPSLQVTWTNSAAGFLLQSAPGLGNAPAWSNVTVPVSQTNNQNAVTLPAQATNLFFRLRRP